MSNRNHDHRHDSLDVHDHHGHTHGVVDPSIATTTKGLEVLKWSSIALIVTASIQLFVVFLSGSVALLADTIHNFGDAATAIPLGIAFFFARKKPTTRYTYGYGRVEDLAGVVIVFIILGSALAAGYESIQHFLHPQTISHVWVVAVAALIGFFGNEAVAIYRIRVGKEIGSAALIADGHHARVDGFTSLAVLVGAIGVWFGYPLADSIVGILITLAIFGIVIQSGKAIFSRMLDGVEPHIVDEIRHAAEHVSEVQNVTEIRARWIGHRIYTEVNIAVNGTTSVAAAHDIANSVRHELLDHFAYLSNVVIHVDPVEHSGESHHKIPDDCKPVTV